MRAAISWIMTFIGVACLAFVVTLMVVSVTTEGPPDPLLENVIRKTVGTIGAAVVLGAAGLALALLRLAIIRGMRAVGLTSRLPAAATIRSRSKR